jgi:hypothetical protein
LVDFFTETCLTLAEAAKLVGRPRRTVERWIAVGLRDGRVKLDALHQGGRIVTSKEALQRFFQELSRSRSGCLEFRPRTSRQRDRDIELARKRLREMGVRVPG